jgi:hypothetical protein
MRKIIQQNYSNRRKEPQKKIVQHKMDDKMNTDLLEDEEIEDNDLDLLALEDEQTFSNP